MRKVLKLYLILAKNLISWILLKFEVLNKLDSTWSSKHFIHQNQVRYQLIKPYFIKKYYKTDNFAEGPALQNQNAKKL